MKLYIFFLDIYSFRFFFIILKILKYKYKIIEKRCVPYFMSKLFRIRYFMKYKIFHLFFSHNYINYIKIQKGEKKKKNKQSIISQARSSSITTIDKYLIN